MPSLHTQTQNLTIAETTPSLLSLSKMLAIKQVAAGVVCHPCFIPNLVTGKQCEVQTMLGGFLSLQPKGSPTFDGIRRRTMVDVNNCIDGMRAEHSSYNSLLCSTFKTLIKVLSSFKRPTYNRSSNRPSSLAFRVGDKNKAMEL